ncbi:MAG: hypothetical protein M1813_002938 [Trichoglossum hirsutum]|nr:MAG: hypothetical protein M1813_002938 [Trichoglossum hirsutum]
MDRPPIPPRATPLGSRSSNVKKFAGGKARNGNILNFFKKVSPQDGKRDDGGGLFFKDDNDVGGDNFTLDYSSVDDLFEDPEPTERYNEGVGSVKRRRLGSDTAETEVVRGEGLFVSPVKGGQSTTRYPKVACSPPPLLPGCGELEIGVGGSRSGSSESVHRAVEEKSKRVVGPFVEDTDSEEEVEPVIETIRDSVKLGSTLKEPDFEAARPGVPDETFQEKLERIGIQKPGLDLDGTNVPEDEELVDIEDYDDDEFAGGEEMAERRWMEEQRRLEMAQDGVDPDFIDDFPEGDDKMPGLELMTEDVEKVAVCPICNMNLDGITDADVTLHVNHCLDGNPIPLPERTKAHPTPPSKRFQRPAKPAQASPFSLGSASGTSSAFSKLMSSHAEDAAWASAAAAETASRGKPAYRRTCPFYKILPGFFICVDAFRYGAVAGCNAYFLSHFHSDHYIGLTASWCHGPIYCSRATGNLVRQQLRVDPKWVVDVEFEKKIEVPNTNGVEVTMIDANHCPGSSLFLFEKVVGKGKNPKVQRVLHCGDFRACAAHIQHPLLRPDVIDQATGKRTGQQLIDVCYLDTTYLNPRYAFPSQEDVIGACANVCVGLAKAQVDGSDEWEKILRGRASRGMAKFVGSKGDVSSSNIGDGDDVHGIKTIDDSSKNKPKSRGRLLVVVGTYSIGKERVCIGIARALKSKIYSPPNKQKICACLEDPELNALLTNVPTEAQVHMSSLMEISTDSLRDYLKDHAPHFSRVVGFRPSGWNYKPPPTRLVNTSTPTVTDILHHPSWRSPFGPSDLVPQRGSSGEAMSFAVPYSEHSSFRELTMFCCAVRIGRVVPTVGVGSQKGRERMRGWVAKWEAEKRKTGCFRIGEGGGKGGVW